MDTVVVPDLRADVVWWRWCARHPAHPRLPLPNTETGNFLKAQVFCTILALVAVTLLVPFVYAPGKGFGLFSFGHGWQFPFAVWLWHLIFGAHLGENLPYGLWRLDNHNGWHGRRAPGYRARRQVADYFRENFLITTSGNFHTRTLVAAIMEVGADRVLFSTDWPFENVDHAAGWFDSAAISEDDRRKIGRDNARREFQLS